MGRLSHLIKSLQIKVMSKSKYIEYLRGLGVTIGKGCDIDKTANFGSEPWLITLGDNVRITRNVEFITHDGGLWTLRKMGIVDKESVKYGRIVIGDNCNISWDSIIMPGVTIAENSIVAAGAVVTKSIPAGCIWGGVPAHHIETVEEYLHKNKDSMVLTCSMGSDEKRKFLMENCPELFE